jgi:hypothetical protein
MALRNNLLDGMNVREFMVRICTDALDVELIHSFDLIFKDDMQ